MSKDIYRKLQEYLDLFSMGFPATKSGIEIKILKYLFTPEDAAMVLSLTHQLETPTAVAQRIGQDIEETAKQLDDMADRGLIFRVKKGDLSRYGAIAFVHGIFEFQLHNLKPDLARMTGDYFKEAFDRNIQESADYFLRVIPVNQSIEPAQKIAAYDDAVSILKSKDKIVVADCICRKRTAVLDEECGKQLEACFLFGSMGQYYLDRDMGRVVELDEAVSILKACREQGLVTQPASSQNPSGMCNCCGDCCGILKAIRQHPEPATIVFSNYLVSSEKDECTGCENCINRCQMDALTLGDDGLIRVVQNRCIGCGLCVETCPTGALKLIEKPEDDRRLPPETTGAQMMQMARKRGVI